MVFIEGDFWSVWERFVETDCGQGSLVAGDIW